MQGFHISVWHALWVPRGTPTQAIAKLNAAVVASLADAAVAKRLADLGQDIPPRRLRRREEGPPRDIGGRTEAAGVDRSLAFPP